MTSAIDPTKPTTGTATTESVRQNFSTAKTEIEDLQAAIISETINRNAAIAAEADARNTAINDAIAQEVIDRNAAIAVETTNRIADVNAEESARIAAVSAEAAARDAAIAAAKAAMWPVGSIYISTTATNPNTLLGFGTWSAFGAGRVLVSQDTGQAEFDTLGETGGAKTHTLSTAEMPAHTHTQDAHNHTQDAHNHTQNPHRHYMPANTGTVAGGGSVTKAYPYTTTNETLDTTATNNATTATNQNTTATNQNTGGGGAHNNLQPYIVVCMWQRTA